ncbi:hypothetical protein GCM10023189_03280 [Nibrella saemangeumensis]|uniref:Outer membrane protein TolC n=1 Tax=Nibrella saemangeumensis TaxID=1084526 RepID=A0ABP8MA19_9BACT
MTPQYLCRIIGLLLLSGSVAAQSATQLQTLLQQAEKRYPSLNAKRYEADATRQQTNVLKTSLLPSLDATAQANLATYNNLTGMFYPAGLLPISGPPSTGNNAQPVAGSAASFLMNWSPFTFGYLDSRMAVAEAELAVKLAEGSDERLRIVASVAKAYLDALLQQELARLAGRNTARADSLLRQVRTLVRQGLRPELDTALVRSELIRAEVEQINAQAAADQARLTLAEWIATPDTTFALTDTQLLARLPRTQPAANTDLHPAEQIGKTQVDLELARRTQIRRSYLPRLTFWGTTYARGSGIDYRGEVNTWEGLAFSRFNYGAGVHLTVPLLRAAERTALLSQQDFRRQAAAERLNQTRLTLDGQRRSAALLRQQTEQVARRLPLQVQAAQQAYTALQVRYQTGLVSLTDVIQTQYALLKAESDNQVATLAVWRALLLEAYARGDLSYFLQALD